MLGLLGQARRTARGYLAQPERPRARENAPRPPPFFENGPPDPDRNAGLEPPEPSISGSMPPVEHTGPERFYWAHENAVQIAGALSGLAAMALLGTTRPFIFAAWSTVVAFLGAAMETAWEQGAGKSLRPDRAGLIGLRRALLLGGTFLLGAGLGGAAAGAAYGLWSAGWKPTLAVGASLVGALIGFLKGLESARPAALLSSGIDEEIRGLLFITFVAALSGLSVAVLAIGVWARLA